MSERDTGSWPIIRGPDGRPIGLSWNVIDHLDDTTLWDLTSDAIDFEDYYDEDSADSDDIKEQLRDE